MLTLTRILAAARVFTRIGKLWRQPQHVPAHR